MAGDSATTYEEFQNAVNMTASELENRLRTSESKAPARKTAVVNPPATPAADESRRC